MRVDGAAALTHDDEQALRAIEWRTWKLAAREELLVEGNTSDTVHVIIKGWAARYNRSVGKRQNSALLLGGDICNIEQTVLERIRFNVVALTPLIVCSVKRSALNDVMKARSSIQLAIWKSIIVESAILRRWITTMAGNSAYAAAAHLICELYHRHCEIGLVRNDCEFELPITQEALGNCLGITGIHTNRILLKLRAEGLISIRQHTLFVHDLQGLASAGNFDPGYLKVESWTELP